MEICQQMVCTRRAELLQQQNILSNVIRGATIANYSERARAHFGAFSASLLYANSLKASKLLRSCSVAFSDNISWLAEFIFGAFLLGGWVGTKTFRAFEFSQKKFVFKTKCSPVSLMDKENCKERE